MAPVIATGSLLVPQSIDFFINTIPSFLFFTGFLIVLFLWCGPVTRIASLPI